MSAPRPWAMTYVWDCVWPRRYRFTISPLSVLRSKRTGPVRFGSWDAQGFYTVDSGFQGLGLSRLNGGRPSSLFASPSAAEQARRARGVVEADLRVRRGGRGAPRLPLAVPFRIPSWAWGAFPAPLTREGGSPEGRGACEEPQRCSGKITPART